MVPIVSIVPNQSFCVGRRRNLFTSSTTKLCTCLTSQYFDLFCFLFFVCQILSLLVNKKVSFLTITFKLYSSSVICQVLFLQLVSFNYSRSLENRFLLQFAQLLEKWIAHSLPLLTKNFWIATLLFCELRGVSSELQPKLISTVEHNGFLNFSKKELMTGIFWINDFQSLCLCFISWPTKKDYRTATTTTRRECIANYQATETLGQTIFWIAEIVFF